MLYLLHIENIAVIEEADITFDSGFNALTGETGAGKSIVIDAMGAVLGQRTSRDLIRYRGAAKAFVSAVFQDVPEPAGIGGMRSRGGWPGNCCCSGRSMPTGKMPAGSMAGP